MPLGQQRAMLLDTGQETGGHVVFGEHDGLAEECAAFGAADVKYVAETGDVCQRHIRTGGCQPVGQAGAVQIQGHLEFPADLRNGLQFLFAVQGAVLRRVGDVDHSGEHHMLMVPVLPEVAYKLL